MGLLDYALIFSTILFSFGASRIIFRRELLSIIVGFQMMLLAAAFLFGTVGVVREHSDGLIMASGALVVSVLHMISGRWISEVLKQKYQNQRTNFYRALRG